MLVFRVRLVGTAKQVGAGQCTHTCLSVRQWRPKHINKGVLEPLAMGHGYNTRTGKQRSWIIKFVVPVKVTDVVDYS